VCHVVVDGMVDGGERTSMSNLGWHDDRRPAGRPPVRPLKARQVRVADDHVGVGPGTAGQPGCIIRLVAVVVETQANAGALTGHTAGEPDGPIDMFTSGTSAAKSSTDPGYPTGGSRPVPVSGCRLRISFPGLSAPFLWITLLIHLCGK
jgi:hypothetical protein